MSQTETVRPPNGAATELLDPRLEQALELLRDISFGVDDGRTWRAISEALAAPPAAAMQARLARVERDVLRVMSIVANPAPAPTYLGDGLVFLPTAHGLPLIGFADDLQITPSLLLHRVWDQPTTHLFERIIRPGDRVLDIGANIGYFTVYGAALAGGTGHVHAFDPNPRTCAVLARNVRLNNCGHVCTLHEVALGDRAGSVTMHVFRQNQASSTLSTLPTRLLDEWHERPVAQAVPMTTLDDVFGDGPEIFSCIKMDAEGSEALIWAGGRRFFEEHVSDRTIVLLEWNPPALRGAGADKGALLDTFHAHGFDVWRRNERLEVTRITGVDQLDDWCNCELVLARDPARIAEVFR
jgi:FkbM family methyltransferase